MSTLRNLIRVSFAAMLAIGLAACGGGDATVEPPDLTPAQSAAAAAATAAAAAATAAAAAVDAVDGIKEHDPSSHALARNAANSASDASDSAQAASAAAAAATTLADAEMYRDAARTAQAEAEAEQAKAMMYAGMVTTAKNEADAAAAEAAALSAAREATATAATAAKTASDAAASVVSAQDANAGADQSSYDAAAAAAQTAMDAYMAAKAASDAAAAAATSAEAQMYQATAETKRGEAEGALDEARMYARLVAEAKVAADADAAEMAALEAAKTAAMTAATGAGAAAQAASAAVEAQRANKDLNTITAAAFARAEDAAADAAKASGDAAVANNAAQMATTSEDAEMYQEQAEAAQRAAELAQANAESFADMVATVKQNMDDAANEASMLAAAQTAAMTAYNAAEAAAVAAEAAADMAEADAPGSSAARDARAAATAARTAADMAKAENEKAQAATDSATAMAAQLEAEAQQNAAEGQQMTAEAHRDDARDARLAAEEAQRKTDVAEAKEAAGAAVMAAETAKDDAETAAMAAEQARDDAMAAYMRAMSARTDATMAKMQYEAAKAAATAAREAATAANDAYMAAQTAADGIMDDDTSEAAQMARMTAETEQGKAEAAADRADTQRMVAETAESDAMTAAGTRVLSLFLAANGAHVMDDESTMDVNETAVHVTAVGTAMVAIAREVVSGPAAGTTATAAWPGDIAADPDAVPAVEAVPGSLSLSVNPDGNGTIPFELRESRDPTDLNNDGDMDDTGEGRIIQTAKEIDPLGVFRGFDIWEDDGTDATAPALHTGDGARVIAFTDKTQDEPPVEAADEVVEVNLDNVEVVTDQVVELGTKSGNNYVGAKYDHDDSATTDPIEGTLICHTVTDCSVSMVGGTLTVTGYHFTGSRAGKDAVTGMDAAAQAAANNDYLVFGLWLDENDAGTTDEFGTFAVGGAAAGAPPVVLTGTATYTGKAAGAHHKTGEAVNWFDGNARLTANFGAIDTDAERGRAADTSPGMISGEISNIRVNGGPALSDSIVLRQTDLTAGTATFNGVARMGAGEIQDDDTVEYPYEGTWSGSFFGPSAAIEADADNNIEAVAAGALAPAAAAGIFGVTGSTGTGDDMVVESFVGAFGAHKE